MVAERIFQEVGRLPEAMQLEVLDFVEYLLIKAKRSGAEDENGDWSKVSLTLAMRGMENENTPEYAMSDLKETFE